MTWLWFLFTFGSSLSIVGATSPLSSQKNRNSEELLFQDNNDDTEELFLQIPTAKSARGNLRFLTKQPHVAGTKGDAIMADFVVQAFQQAGIPNVTTFSLDVMLNYPNISQEQPSSKLLLWSKSKDDDDLSSSLIYEAKLSEDVLPTDDTSDTVWRNHTFHGYSPSGYVQNAPMVYANYGRPQDFDVLEAAGVVVNNTVVLVRYGKCFRGLKVRNAQQRGALAVLIYSDPADDGYHQGPVYPHGPWRPSSGVQRGSVQFNSLCAGDPYRMDSRYEQNALQDLCGVSSSQDLIPSIPSLPISYQDATPLLQNMGGPLAKDIGGMDYCGGIYNLTYRVGGFESDSTARVELQVSNINQVKAIPNVIGIIPGSLAPEQDMPVLLGNHRDAWVYGAADPNSGTAALLEVAKGLGKLYRDENWRPLRSIYLLSWSGEEYGLLGSTGWGELNANDVSLQRALAYLNVDTAVSGNILEASASPTLTTIWKETLKDVMRHVDKDENNITIGNGALGSLVDANTNWKWRSLTAATEGEEVNDETMGAPEIGILGSGSDYTVFLDHLGIPSLDFHFSKSTTYGQYHSIYDSFAWMDQYGGQGERQGSSFAIMALAAKIWGLLAMRLATRPLVPLDHVAQGVALSQYVKAIEQQEQRDEKNTRTKQMTIDKLDLTALKHAVQLYQEAAASLRQYCFEAADHQTEEAANKAFDGHNVDEASLSTLGSHHIREGPANGVDDIVWTCNEKLGLTERYLLHGKGLPGRPWFKHVLQAPGMDMGYASEAFPGIQQAIDNGDFQLAQEQVFATAGRVQAAAKHLQVPPIVQ